MPKARRALLCDGGVITTCLEDCWASEEVADVEIEVSAGTLCDICEEEILDSEESEDAKSDEG